MVYDEIRRRLGGQQDFPPQALADSAGIIRHFIEDYHEKLEEDFLFPRFRKAQKHVELVDALQAQHQAGRKLTDRIVALSTAPALKNDDQRRTLGEYLRLFNRMYSVHEAREDTVLFPAFHELVSGREYDTLGDQFEKREHDVLGPDGFEKMVDRVAGIGGCWASTIWPSSRRISKRPGLRPALLKWGPRHVTIRVLDRRSLRPAQRGRPAGRRFPSQLDRVWRVPMQRCLISIVAAALWGSWAVGGAGGQQLPIQAAMARSQQTGFPMLVVGVTDSCPWCKKLHAQLQSEADLQPLLQQYVSFDAQGRHARLELVEPALQAQQRRRAHRVYRGRRRHRAVQPGRGPARRRHQAVAQHGHRQDRRAETAGFAARSVDRRDAADRRPAGARQEGRGHRAAARQAALAGGNDKLAGMLAGWTKEGARPAAAKSRLRQRRPGRHAGPGRGAAGVRAAAGSARPAQKGPGRRPAGLPATPLMEQAQAWIGPGR